MWQRLRSMEASTDAGIGLTLVTTAAIVWIVMSPPAYGFSEGTDLLQRPMRSELHVLVLAALGFWMALRGTHSPGRAAIRASVIWLDSACRGWRLDVVRCSPLRRGLARSVNGFARRRNCLHVLQGTAANARLCATPDGAVAAVKTPWSLAVGSDERFAWTKVR